MKKIIELNNPHTTSNHIYINYFLEKYITLYYQNMGINKILIKNINNRVYIYVFLHEFSATYNLKKHAYLIRSLKYFLGINVYLYCLNFNNTFLIKVLKIQKVKKLTNAFSSLSKTLQNKKIDIKLLLIFLFSLKIGDFKALTNYFSSLLKTTKNHFFIINYINNFIKLFLKLTPLLNSITIQIKGRLNGSARSKKYFITHTKNINVNGKCHYNFIKVQTFYGVCSIKLWINSQ